MFVNMVDLSSSSPAIVFISSGRYYNCIEVISGKALLLHHAGLLTLIVIVGISGEVTEGATVHTRIVCAVADYHLLALSHPLYSVRPPPSLCFITGPMCACATDTCSAQYVWTVSIVILAYNDDDDDWGA